MSFRFFVIGYELFVISRLSMRFVYQIIVNTVAIIAASRYLAGFSFSGDLVSLAWVAFLLTAANYFLKPVLKLIFGPLILLTLGLFTIVINMIIIYIVSYYTPELKVDGIQTLFWATILFGFVNLIFSLIFKNNLK